MTLLPEPHGRIDGRRFELVAKHTTPNPDSAASPSSTWQVCLLGLIMAFGIPLLAWVENSALFLLLIAAAVLGFVAVLWWYWRERGK
jgi:hypothetical protein